MPEIATPFMTKVSKTLNMLLGSHLDAHIMGKVHRQYDYPPYLVIKCALYVGGYKFLMQNCGSLFFSFWRGALFETIIY